MPVNSFLDRGHYGRCLALHWCCLPHHKSQRRLHKNGLFHILSNRAFGWVGDHAYGLYLWHWPLLIFYLALRDREAVCVRGGAVIFVTAVVLAVVMHQFIEKPLNTLGQRKRGPVLDWVSLGGGITAAAVGVLLAFPYLPKDGDRVANSLDFDQTTHP